MDSSRRSLSRSEFLKAKPDYSDFLLHLTRRSGERTAAQTLFDILNDGMLKAQKSHCLFDSRLNELPDDIREQFKVVCFSDCPPGAVKAFSRRMAGRSYQPEPFGLYFSKSFLRREGVRPVFYTPWPTSKAMFRIWELLVGQEDWRTLSDVMPYISHMSPDFDWHWEREWRIAQNLRFDPADLECIFCPAAEQDHFQMALADDPEMECWLDVSIIDVEEL